MRIDTDDWRDEPEVWSVERVLRSFGIQGPLRYRIRSKAIGRLSGPDAYKSLPSEDGSFQRLRLARRDGNWDAFSESDWDRFEPSPVPA